MGTAVATRAPLTRALPGRRYDHAFFSAVVALMLATVVAGFGPTYYYTGFWKAPLPSPIIHVHAVLFSCWLLMLIAQVSLVSAHRVDVHRRLGIAGCILACAMVISGVLAATDSLNHVPRVPRDVLAFYIVPLSNMVMFSVLMFFAYRLRRDAASHKRLIMLASTALMIAAVTRWHVVAIRAHTMRASLVSDIFLLMLIAYDLFSLRKIHRVTIWGGAFLLVVQLTRLPLGETAAWHHFAGWAQTLAK